jgi:hypothetical protein
MAKTIFAINRDGYSMTVVHGGDDRLIISAGTANIDRGAIVLSREEECSLLDSLGVPPLGAAPDPIPMLLTCPSCNERHIDEGEFATKPHHTHACQSCGLVWRPAKVDTVGVRFLPGYKNEEPHGGTFRGTAAGAAIAA